MERITLFALLCLVAIALDYAALTRRDSVSCHSIARGRGDHRNPAVPDRLVPVAALREDAW